MGRRDARHIRPRQDIAQEVYERRQAAHRKHGDQSVEGADVTPDRLMSILTEEVGEVAKVLNERALGNLDDEAMAEQLEGELYDVLTVATAWLDRIQP